MKQTCPHCGDDNLERPENCYCDEEQGGGYSYADEWGDCDVCEDEGLQCKGCNKYTKPKDLIWVKIKKDR